MFTIRHCVALVSVLCLSTAGAHAQDNIPSVLVTNKEEEAIAKHRLTVENVRTMFAVERELLELMKKDPDLGRRSAELGTRVDPQNLLGSFTREVKIHEGMPEIAQILRRQNVSAREYLLTQTVAFGAERLDETLKDEFLRREFDKDELMRGMMKTQALQFFRTMDPALKAEWEEWKRVREEMERLGHGK